MTLRVSVSAHRPSRWVAVALVRGIQKRAFAVGVVADGLGRGAVGRRVLGLFEQLAQRVGPLVVSCAFQANDLGADVDLTGGEPGRKSMPSRPAIVFGSAVMTRSRSDSLNDRKNSRRLPTSMPLSRLIASVGEICPPPRMVTVSSPDARSCTALFRAARVDPYCSSVSSSALSP